MPTTETAPQTLIRPEVMQFAVEMELELQRQEGMSNPSAWEGVPAEGWNLIPRTAIRGWMNAIMVRLQGTYFLHDLEPTIDSAVNLAILSMRLVNKTRLKQQEQVEHQP